MRTNSLTLAVSAAALAVLCTGIGDVCHAQGRWERGTDTGSWVEVDSIPAHGNFWLMGRNLPPLPFDPYPDLPLYTDGTGNYFIDDRGDRGFHPDSPSPLLGPGGGDGGGGGSGGSGFCLPNFVITTNYETYTNFWLSITNIGGTNYVSVESTLSNLTYLILTNDNLANTNGWSVWTSLLATTSVTPARPLDVGTNTIFFNAALVWSTCTNANALPDWESMLYYNSLCVPTNGGYITNGLAAYWRFNDRSGDTAADSSGNGIGLPLTNSPTWGSLDLNLNGSNQYGDAGSNALTSLDTNDMTICAWINKTGSSPKGIVDKDYYISAGDYGGWSFLILTNQLAWSVEADDGYQDNGPTAIPLGQWTFVTVTWAYPNTSSNAVAFYINGVLNSETGISGVSERASGPANLEVANLRNNLEDGTFAFDGSMHDVAIYSRVLSSLEVASNFLRTEFDTNVPYPDSLYYKMLTEYAQTNIPVRLSNSATDGGSIGTVTLDPAALPEWTNNPGGISNALHFNGVSTRCDTSNSSSFNFTTNSFTINLWLLPLTTNGFVMGNNSDGASGWFMSVYTSQPSHSI